MNSFNLSHELTGCYWTLEFKRCFDTQLYRQGGEDDILLKIFLLHSGNPIIRLNINWRYVVISQISPIGILKFLYSYKSLYTLICTCVLEKLTRCVHVNTVKEKYLHTSCTFFLHPNVHMFLDEVLNLCTNYRTYVYRLSCTFLFTYFSPIIHVFLNEVVHFLLPTLYVFLDEAVHFLTPCP